MLSRVQKQGVLSGLLQLGFSDKEALIYLAALEGGEMTIPTLAEATGLSRGTVYDVVEKLKGGNFMTEIRKGKKHKLVVENPAAKLYSLLEQMHGHLQESKRIVDDILPTINALRGGQDFKPQIRVYEGEKGFRNVWDEIFTYEGKEFLSIARIETYIKFMGEEFLQDIQERKAKLGFASRAINEESSAAKKMKLNDAKFARETRLAPAEYKFPSSEIIFGDKIAMFSTRDENIIVVIESRDFAETHRQYFEMLWKSLEK